MKSFVRRLVITGGATAVLLAAGGTTAGTTTAHAATGDAAACTVSGSATITPGLGPVPTNETFTIDSGATITCHGTFSGSGTFTGNGACNPGGLATCVGGTISFRTGSIGGHVAVGTNCTLTQQGAAVQVTCTTSQGTDNGAGALILAHVAFTPQNPTQNPVKNVNFNGTAAIVG